jgi:hypothetical protein
MATFQTLSSGKTGHPARVGPVWAGVGGTIRFKARIDEIQMAIRSLFDGTLQGSIPVSPFIEVFSIFNAIMMPA